MKGHGMPGGFQLRTGIAAFSSGVILLYWIGEILPAPVFVVATLIALLSFIGCSRSVRWSRYRPVFAVLFFLTVGLAWATGKATLRLEARLPASLETEPLSVVGYRCSLPAPGSYSSIRFDFCVTGWPQHSDQLASVRKLRLAVYGDAADLAIPHLLMLDVRLKQPHGAYNPEGFHYESWLFRQGYHATGSVQNWQQDLDGACPLRCQYHQWRESIADSLQAQFGTLTHYPLIESLLLGERRFLNQTDWALFRTTGTSHLIAISGLHIGLVGAMVGFLVRFVLYPLPPGWITLPQRRLLIIVLGLTGCGVYALMAGFSVPTQRALIMAAVAGVVYLRGRLSGYWTAWLAALALVLLVDPFTPLDRGFWLSFVAVACLILAFAGRLRPPGKIITVLQAQFAITAGMLPVLAVMQQAPAALGWLANILAIPWLSLGVMPLLFLGAAAAVVGAPGLETLSWLMDQALGLLVGGLEQVAAITPQTEPATMVFAAGAGILLFAVLFAGSRYAQVLIGVSVCALFFGFHQSVATSKVNSRVDVPELWVWDVGQGLSVLFRDGDEALLYDTGPGSPAGFSAVDSVVLPNLKALGVNKLALLVVSHGDADHASGLGALLNSVQARHVVSGEPARLDFSPLQSSTVPAVVPCREMAPVTIGAATIEFWQAPPNQRAPGNDASCIARIRLSGAEIILPGDSSQAIEEQWLADNTTHQKLPRILLASHHGSQTSSGRRWVNALSPDFVVFSAGYRHPYGHPAAEVKARFDEIQSVPFNTAQSGAVHFRIEAGHIKARALREHAPFWIAPFERGDP
jgi:competence protein ComEC